METILFLKNNGLNGKELQNIINKFVINVNKSLKLLLSNNNKVVLDNCHTLKGFFENKQLKELLKKQQPVENIRKNYNIIKNLINIELKKIL